MLRPKLYKYNRGSLLVLGSWFKVQDACESEERVKRDEILNNKLKNMIASYRVYIQVLAQPSAVGES